MKINTTDNVVVLKGMSFYGATADKKYILMSNNRSDIMYLYIDSKTLKDCNTTDILKKHFSSDEVVRFTTVVLKDEIEMLNSAGITDEEYAKTLKNFNLCSAYNLFRIEIKQNKVKKSTQYKDESNLNDNTLYIILRNDLGLSAGMQATYASEVTTAMAGDLIVDCKKVTLDEFMDMNKNVVILQASGKDLFENNFIPAEYSDPNVNFTYIFEDTKKVAHHNFRLTEGKIVALGFFGVKKHLPKFLRKLPLYGE